VRHIGPNDLDELRIQLPPRAPSLVMP
jgi:hypothetical protein